MSRFVPVRVHILALALPLGFIGLDLASAFGLVGVRELWMLTSMFGLLVGLKNSRSRFDFGPLVMGWKF